jgi:hypothetical protein
MRGLSTTGIVVITLMQMFVCYLMYAIGKATTNIKLEAITKLFAAYVLTVEMETNELKNKIKSLEGDK